MVDVLFGKRPENGTILRVFLPFSNVIKTLNLYPNFIDFDCLVTFFCALKIVLFLRLSITLGEVYDFILLFLIVFVCFNS